MSELHIAALPFPSYQGTQAAIRSMVEARGACAELFTYGAQGYAWTPSFRLHRGPDNAHVALRSGPSWTKILADLRMARALPGVCRRSGARVLIAHHVEAMALACCMRGLPRVFFAHTDLAAELPSYAPSRFARILSQAGALTDRVLCSQADAIAAISPALCETLQAATGLRATYVPTPWTLPAPIHDTERQRARRKLGLSSGARVALYAGNLDAYQDAEQTIAALAQLAAAGGPRLALLLATNSNAERFLTRAQQLGVPCHRHPLGGEPIRRQLHAAADLAIVPRATPGGLPMKLLDALSRGLPCALAPLAAAGLRLKDYAEQAQAPGPSALAAAIARLCAQLDQPAQRTELSHKARQYIATHHSTQRFHGALEQVLTQAHSLRGRSRAEQPGSQRACPPL